jgi:hypothetical protein
MNWLKVILTCSFVVLFELQAAPSAQSSVACIDFEVSSSSFGKSMSPGSLFLTANKIQVWLDFFHQNNQTYFNSVNIVPAISGFGHGQIASVNNVSLLFDFTGLPFIPKMIELNFADQGGRENLSINGSPIYIGEISKVKSTLGGAKVQVNTGKKAGIYTGVLRVTGTVFNLSIGGQEFFLDDICARP